MRKITRELTQDMMSWRHDIHRHPEFGFEESRTAALVAETLESLGLEVETGIGTTGVVGKLSKGKSNRAIGLPCGYGLPPHSREKYFCPSLGARREDARLRA